MVKKSGNVTSALKDMQSNLIGRPTTKPVAPGNTNVIVGPYLPGIITFTYIYIITILITNLCMIFGVKEAITFILTFIVAYKQLSVI